MIKLLTLSTQKVTSNVISFGGLPSADPANFNWPICKTCNLPMQYLGKIVMDVNNLLLFMCQNEPRMCSDYEADSGDNKVLKIKRENLEIIEPPSEGITQLEEEYSAAITEYNSDDYEEAREKWSKENKVSRRQVLGQISGNVSWLQSDETPDCDTCGKPMKFVAQLEEGPNAITDMNFGGGGVAYIFECDCEHSAKFLWQC